MTNPSDPSTLPLPTQDVEVLMVRRKDSMCYTDFVRGKYDPTDETYVRTLLANMTQQEIHRIKTETFEALWARLWNNSERHEYEMKTAKEKFEAVASEIGASSSPYTEPEWGFPKGRRLKCENDHVCAEREFFEETNIPRAAYTMVSGLHLEETFTGTNGVVYRHRYFIAVLSRPSRIDIHQRFTYMQKREISAIGWKTLADCVNLTRPQYTQRRDMLHDLSVLAENVEVRLPKY